MASIRAPLAVQRLPFPVGGKKIRLVMEKALCWRSDAKRGSFCIFCCACGLCRLKMDKSEPSVLEASVGERARLPCTVEASPALTIEWQKDGQPLSSPRWAPRWLHHTKRQVLMEESLLLALPSLSPSWENRAAGCEARAVLPHAGHLPLFGQTVLLDCPHLTYRSKSEHWTLKRTAVIKGLQVSQSWNLFIYKMSRKRTHSKQICQKPAGLWARTEVHGVTAVNFHSSRCCSPAAPPTLCSQKPDLAGNFSGVYNTSAGIWGPGVVLPELLLNLCSVLLQNCAQGSASGLMAGVLSWPKRRLRRSLVLFPRYRQQSDGALVISRVSSEDVGLFTCIASNGRDQDQRQVLFRPLGTGWAKACLYTSLCAHEQETGRAGQWGFLI